MQKQCEALCTGFFCTGVGVLRKQYGGCAKNTAGADVTTVSAGGSSSGAICAPCKSHENTTGGVRP